MFAAACIGKKHEDDSKKCQDKVYHIYKNSINAIALADGAGSKKQSDLGAFESCRHICIINTDSFDELCLLSETELISHYSNIIANHINSIALKNSVEVKELSSTLLFVATNGKKYIAGHIGDGLIACIKNNKIEMFSDADNDMYSNFTFFTTSDDLKNHFRIYKGDLGNISSFILMSDGTSDVMFNNQDKIFSKALLDINEWPKFETPEKIEKQLKNILYGTIREKTTDDCSLGFLNLVEYSIFSPALYRRLPGAVYNYINEIQRKWK